MPVYKQGVEDSIKSSLLTTIGDIIAASAVSTPARVAAPASGQVFTGQGAGVLPAWAAAATGAVTRAGGNTTEATTTSLTGVDILTTSGLSIANTSPLQWTSVHRKSIGAANTASVGVKFNATQIYANTAWSGAGNTVQSGSLSIHSSARVSGAAYDNGMVWGIRVQGITVANLLIDFANGNTPVVTITDLVVTGLVADALITMGADEMHVYTYAVS